MWVVSNAGAVAQMPLSSVQGCIYSVFHGFMSLQPGQFDLYWHFNKVAVFSATFMGQQRFGSPFERDHASYCHNEGIENCRVSTPAPGSGTAPAGGAAYPGPVPEAAAPPKPHFLRSPIA